MKMNTYKYKVKQWLVIAVLIFSATALSGSKNFNDTNFPGTIINQQTQAHVATSNPVTVSSKELDQIKALGLNVGMWSYVIVFGEAGNIICEANVKRATEILTELGIPEYSKSLSCTQKKEYDEVNKIIENIAEGVTSAYGIKTGDFFRINSYCITAQFYIAAIKNSTDPFIVSAYALLTKIAIKDGINAAGRIGIQDRIVQDGSKIVDDVNSLTEKSLPSGEVPLYADSLTKRLMDWVKDALDAATDILLMPDNESIDKAIELVASTSNMLQHNRAKEILTTIENFEIKDIKEGTLINKTLKLIRIQISELNSLSNENQKKMDDPEVKNNNFLLALHSTLASACILTSEAFNAIIKEADTYRSLQKSDNEILIMIKDELNEMVSKYVEK
jgi:hypothetical protein